MVAPAQTTGVWGLVLTEVVTVYSTAPIPTPITINRKAILILYNTQAGCLSAHSSIQMVANTWWGRSVHVTRSVTECFPK